MRAGFTEADQERIAVAAHRAAAAGGGGRGLGFAAAAPAVSSRPPHDDAALLARAAARQARAGAAAAAALAARGAAEPSAALQVAFDDADVETLPALAPVPAATLPARRHHDDAMFSRPAVRPPAPTRDDTDRWRPPLVDDRFRDDSDSDDGGSRSRRAPSPPLPPQAARAATAAAAAVHGRDAHEAAGGEAPPLYTLLRRGHRVLAWRKSDGQWHAGVITAAASAGFAIARYDVTFDTGGVESVTADGVGPIHGIDYGAPPLAQAPAQSVPPPGTPLSSLDAAYDLLIRMRQGGTTDDVAGDVLPSVSALQAATATATATTAAGPATGGVAAAVGEAAERRSRVRGRHRAALAPSTDGRVREADVLLAIAATQPDVRVAMSSSVGGFSTAVAGSSAAQFNSALPCWAHTLTLLADGEGSASGCAAGDYCRYRHVDVAGVAALRARMEADVDIVAVRRLGEVREAAKTALLASVVAAASGGGVAARPTPAPAVDAGGSAPVIDAAPPTAAPVPVPVEGRPLIEQVMLATIQRPAGAGDGVAGGGSGSWRARATAKLAARNV